MFLIALVLSFVGLVSAAFRFNFSTIEQCAPVQISFTGNDNADPIPSSLLLLPFNSTPFSIPIPNAAANSTGITVTFLPLAAGTQFIASLDDSSGDNSARVSDVFRVQPSSTGDDSCLPTSGSTHPFILPTSVSQCEPFAVSYQDAAPSVRVFFPTGGSFPLDIEQDDIQSKTAHYTLNATRGFPILLMVFPQDNPSAGMTTPLLTVGGDASSDSSCIVVDHHPTKKDSSSSASSTPMVSKGLIIGLAVGGSVIMLLALLMIVYLVRERRRRRRIPSDTGFNPSMLEKRPYDDDTQSPGFIQSREYKPSMAFSQGSQQGYAYALRYEHGFVRDPPYTAEKYSPSNSDFDAQSAQSPVSVSWMADPPIPVITRAASQKNTIRSAKTASSINPYDIERMLDVAADDQPELPRPIPDIREPPEAKTSPPRQTPVLPPLETSNLPVSRAMPARGHLRTPSDVPADPSSVVMSAYSNMFAENNVVFESPKSTSDGPSSRFSYASSSNFEILTRPSNIITTLSPLAKQPVTSRFSDISAVDSGIEAPRPAFTRAVSPSSTESWGNVVGVAR